MDAALGSLIAIVFLVIALNFIALFIRLSRTRSRKPTRPARAEAEAARWRDKEVQRRIDREQEEAVHRVELRNKTLELYEEVRKRAAAREKAAAMQDDMNQGG